MPSRWEFFKARVSYVKDIKLHRAWFKLTGRCWYCGQRKGHKFSCYGYDVKRLASRRHRSDDSRYNPNARWETHE